MDLQLLAHNGVFSAADATRVGLGTQALDRLITEGRCIRLTRGWYAPVVSPPQPEQRHRLATLALGRQFRDRAAISHYSRLLLAKIATYSVDLETVHLTLADRAPAKTRVTSGTRKPRGVGSRRPGLKIHRPVRGLRPDEGAAAHLTEDPTGPSRPSGQRAARPVPWAVPIGWAVVQTGLEAGPESALVSADSALHQSLVTSVELEEAVRRLAGHPGMATVRPALAFADGRHESPGETRTAYLLRQLGFELEPQFEVVAEGRRYRADFRVEGTRVLVEFDGQVKYDDRSALFAEKQREDALRREGWVVVRLVWRDLASPALVRRRVDAAIAAASTV